jgi:2-methylcitrate dehydratase PrpD
MVREDKTVNMRTVVDSEAHPGLTERLAASISRVQFGELPAQVVQRAKNSILDTVGVALAGTVEPGARLLADYVGRNGGNPVCSLWGRRAKSSVRNAALVNGMAAHMLGYSDLSVTPVVHPSISVLPAVLALAEARRASGKDVITAYVVGVELACKLGAVVGSRFNVKGWHPCSVLGGFAATAGAARILGLDSLKTANALGLAGMQTSGIKAGMGTMAKAYGAGRAAENGVVAAELAQQAFTGPTTVLEGTDGFLQTFGDGVSGERMLDSFGRPYHFADPGVALKPYPSCTCSHTSITAVLALRKQHGIKPEHVGEIECSVSPAVANYLKFPRPKDALQAKYSLQFCVAVALIDGGVDIGTFVDERVRDPQVVALMERTAMVVSPELAAQGFNPDSAPFGSRVTVRLKDGRELHHRQDKGPWEPETAPSWHDLLPKYFSCARIALEEPASEETVAIIARLEEQKDLGRLMDLLRG